MNPNRVILSHFYREHMENAAWFILNWLNSYVLSARSLSKQRGFLKVGMAQHSKGVCLKNHLFIAKHLIFSNTFDAVGFVWDKDNN